MGLPATHADEQAACSGFACARRGGQLFVYSCPMLLFETFAVGQLGCNCSIVADADSKDAIVVDPGGDFERIDQVLRHYDLTVRAIVHTHAHLDHIMATRDVKEAHGGEIGLHPDDLFLYDGIAMQAAMF